MKWRNECTKLRASRAFVPYAPYVPMCFTYSRPLRAFVPFLRKCLTFFLRALCAFIFLRTLRALIFLCALRAFIFYMPSFFYVPSFFYMFTFLFMHMLIIIKLTQINELTFDCTSLLLLNSVIYHSCHILYFFFFLKRKILITFNAEEST